MGLENCQLRMPKALGPQGLSMMFRGTLSGLGIPTAKRMLWGKWLPITPHLLPRPCPGRSHRGAQSGNGPTRGAWATAAGADSAGLPLPAPHTPIAAWKHCGGGPGRGSGGGLWLAPPGFRTAGFRLAGTGCGATSRGNLAGSAAPGSPAPRLLRRGAGAPARALSPSNAPNTCGNSCYAVGPRPHQVMKGRS